MSLATVFDKLGQTIIPAIAAKVFPDTMYVVSETTASDGAGGVIKSAVTDTDHRNDDPIPCTYEPKPGTGTKATQGDRLTSLARYTVTYPTHQYGTRILIAVGNRLKVIERGNEPEKTFRVMAIGNYSGVNFEAECELEDAT